MPRLFSWVAILGTTAVLIEQTVSALPLKTGQAWAFPFLIIAASLVAATLTVLMPSAARRLLQQPDLLVPLGLLILASGVLGWLQRLPVAAPALTPSFTPRIGSITLGTLSVAWAVQLLLHAAYATWATVLVVAVVRSGRADLSNWLTDLRSWFLRILGLSCVGWGVNWLIFALELALGLTIAMGAFVIAMAAVSFGWNLMTAALLLVALEKPRGFLATLGAGLTASWRGKRLWWHLVLAQLLLLGLWAFVSYRYTHTSQAAGGGTSENVGVNFNLRF
jgi:hypothetical protein